MVYFNDDGREYIPNLYSIPSLCIICKKKDNSKEEMICNLTRMGQLGEEEFRYFAYEKNLN